MLESAFYIIALLPLAVALAMILKPSSWEQDERFKDDKEIYRS